VHCPPHADAGRQGRRDAGVGDQAAARTLAPLARRVKQVQMPTAQFPTALAPARASARAPARAPALAEALAPSAWEPTPARQKRALL